MTKEELLKPRYKVIADYPESRYNVGSIFYKYEFVNGNYAYVENTESPLDGRVARVEWVENYPIHFRKLEWWEDRKPEDMPQYVKERKEGGMVARVKKHFTNSIGEDNKKGCQLDIVTDWNFFSYSIWQPATEEEYNQYLKSNQ